jgi:hypothetical protein
MKLKQLVFLEINPRSAPCRLLAKAGINIQTFSWPMPGSASPPYREDSTNAPILQRWLRGENHRSRRLEVPDQPGAILDAPMAPASTSSAPTPSPRARATACWFPVQ